MIDALLGWAHKVERLEGAPPSAHDLAHELAKGATAAVRDCLADRTLLES